jgi:ferritin-like protein
LFGARAELRACIFSAYGGRREAGRLPPANGSKGSSMILLQQQLFTDLDRGDQPAVLKALQDALRLEHATLPLYLYSYYSLMPGKNSDIANVIWSVIMEEMLHMALVCNIINALGGSPEINNPSLIPQYPGPLPGGVEGDLRVHLAPYSAEQLETFLQVEQPEHPLNFPIAAEFAQPPQTIGRFYRDIEQKIIALGDSAFVKPPRNQVDGTTIANAIIVTNVATASQAIDLIVEQGEGTETEPGEVVGIDFAHYYRFNQIKKGKLAPNPKATPDTPPDERFIYSGTPFPFDPSGVYQVPRDPKAADYAAASPERAAMDDFNVTYSDLLNELQQGFNGSPGELSLAIFTTMSDLDSKARALVQTLLGPSFEYRTTVA